MTFPPVSDMQKAYIDLITRTITNFAYLGGQSGFRKFNFEHVYDTENARWRTDMDSRPLTLLNKEQLDLLETLVESLEARGVPGDYIEAGVWRGGVIVLLRALIKAYAIPDRRVFAADSFSGIPQNKYFRHDPVDAWSDRWIASLKEVQNNIRRFGLLDDRIVFVAGLFADSLPALAGDRFALIRLDSDSYESVATSLDHLYPALSEGGVLLIDDWHLIPCQMAVANYRKHHGIEDPIETVAGNAYWIKRQRHGFPVTR